MYPWKAAGASHYLKFISGRLAAGMCQAWHAGILVAVLAGYYRADCHFAIWLLYRVSGFLAMGWNTAGTFRLAVSRLLATGRANYSCIYRKEYVSFFVCSAVGKLLACNFVGTQTPSLSQYMLTLITF